MEEDFYVPVDVNKILEGPTEAERYRELLEKIEEVTWNAMRYAELISSKQTLRSINRAIRDALGSEHFNKVEPIPEPEKNNSLFQEYTWEQAHKDGMLPNATWEVSERTTNSKC